MVSNAALQRGPELLAGWVPVMADAVVKGTVLLLVVFGLAQVLRKGSAATRHLVWGLGLSGLLVLPALSAVLPWRLELPRPALAETVRGWVTAADGDPHPIAGAPDLTEPAAAAPLDAAGARDAAGAAGQDPATSSSDVPTPSTAASSSATSSSSAASASSDPQGALSRPAARTNVERAGAPGVATTLAALLAAVWLAGAAVSLARLGAGVLALRRLARRATHVVEASWRAPLRTMARRLGLRRPVRLLRSQETPLPMAWGVVRPVVVLPPAADEWPEERRQAVLLHELAHVRRRDVAVHLLGRAACALYWFHPLAWSAARRLRAESERACDDLVLGAGTRPSEYAEHLLEIAQAVGRVRSPAAALAFGRRSDFEGRLLAILDPATRRGGLTRARAWVLVAVAVLALVPLAAAGPARAGAASGGGTGTGTIEPLAQDTGRAGRRAAPRRGAEREALGTGQQEPVRGRSGLSEKANADPDAEVDVDSRIAIAMEPPEDVELGEHPYVDVGSVAVQLSAFLPAAVAEAARFAAEQHAGAEKAGGTSATQQERSAAVPALLEALRDPDPEVRLAVVRTLADLEDARAVEPLAAVLSDEAVEVRRAAAHALGQIENPRAVAALAEALRQDPDAEVRHMAAWALGQIEHASAVPALSAALLDDADARVRQMAAWALGQIESADAVDALGAALQDSSVEVRRTAVWALGQIEDARAVPALLAGLGDADVEIRRQSAWALGEIESGEAVEPLVAMLQDEHAEVRRTAAWALGQIGDARAATGLAAALRDGDTEVRRTAAWALAELDLREAPPVLLEALGDEDVQVRRSAAHALGEIEDPAAVGPLSNALRDPDLEVRRSALRALAEIRTPAALDVLIQALKDEDPEIRKLAARALGSR